MGRFRNGIPRPIRELVLSRDVPDHTPDLKVILEVDGKFAGVQWLHCPDGRPTWFLDKADFDWNVLARAIELIEALNRSEGGEITNIRFESTTPRMPPAAILEVDEGGDTPVPG